MIRKLVKQGENALTVTLPAGWIKKQGLKPGNEIALQEIGNTIEISASKQKSEKRYEIKLNKEFHYEDYFLRRFISSIYKKDYDEIVIHFDNPGIAAYIEQCVHELMGLEIINQTGNTIVIRNISRELEDQFDNIFKKCVNQVLDGARLTAKLLAEKDEKIAAEIYSLEKMNNRFSDLLKRSLNRVGYYDTEKTLFYSSIVRDVEKMVDEYRDTCKYIMSEKIRPISKGTKDFYKFLEEVCSLFVTLNFVFSYEKLALLRQQKKRLSERYPIILNIVPKEEIVIIISAFVVIKDIFELIGALFAIHLPPSAKKEFSN